MGSVLLVLTFAVGIVAGPFVVARFFPARSRFQGNVLAGQSGVSTMFWGAALGLAAGLVTLAILIVVDPVGGALRVQIETAALLLATLGLIVVPLVVCGFHGWRWDSNGLEFVGAFRRTKVAWKELASVDRTLDRGLIFKAADRASVRTSEYTVGAQVIEAALSHYRPDLAPALT